MFELLDIVVTGFEKRIGHGGFFDNFEYFHFLRDNGLDAHFLLQYDTDRELILQMFDEKYSRWNKDYLQYMHFYPHSKRIIPFRAKLCFSAVNSSLCFMIKRDAILAHYKCISLCDFFANQIPDQFYRFYRDAEFYGDERVFGQEDYSIPFHPYRKKIYFDIYTPKEEIAPFENNTLLNLSTKRFYTSDQLSSILNSYPPQKYIAYTNVFSEKYYEEISRDPNYDITLYKELIPNLQKQYNKFIYMCYSNGMDATPRLIPESLFYEKEVIYHDTGYTNGGYYRYRDCIQDLNSVMLTSDDDILNIVDDAVRNVKC